MTVVMLERLAKALKVKIITLLTAEPDTEERLPREPALVSATA